MNLKAAALTMFIFVTQSAWATDSRTTGISTPDVIGKCAVELENCFSRTNLSRNDCFFEITEKSPCQNTQLGNLAYKRWVFSAAHTPGKDTPPSLLGPGLVDGNCVNNFDNQWLSDLVREDYSKETITALDRKLESCRQSSSQELLRP